LYPAREGPSLPGRGCSGVGVSLPRCPRSRVRRGVEARRICRMDAALLKAIASLPRDERIALVEAVWDGLVANEEAPSVTDAQARELDARLDAMARAPDATLAWDEVRARLAQRGG